MTAEIMVEKALKLPKIDLASPDRVATARANRQVCLDHGFFSLINHQVDSGFIKGVFEETRKFFSLPLPDKLKVACNEGYRGYTAMCAETLDPSINSTGDLKEMFSFGPQEGITPQDFLNQWPPKDMQG
ncbi:hypothetical protein H6P81_005168 [Aristolochia fimbriata]|uniref:Non-haem dioxygenase N-terminal domain-containing protein n=1 Tax=Aristolochia fimbriata TaxID=158543 RepID=A0AAV7EUE7_ARIFI|nr:hypothetical protein H6P81_005168 [Aristolochia fimbriata]